MAGWGPELRRAAWAVAFLVLCGLAALGFAFLVMVAEAVLNGAR